MVDHGRPWSTMSGACFLGCVPPFSEPKIISEMCDSRGLDIKQYDAADLEVIASSVAGDNYRLRLDVGRALVRLHDGFETWLMLCRVIVFA